MRGCFFCLHVFMQHTCLIMELNSYGPLAHGFAILPVSGMEKEIETRRTAEKKATKLHYKIKWTQESGVDRLRCMHLLKQFTAFLNSNQRLWRGL